ncbi:MAG: hypothetical protein ACJAVO_000034 [Parvibaculaceae bacterium]|jgi:uncharacterized protein (DUF952 family)|tara:strand:- start:72 stop:470 length:399 start_codon:yes stop_codon:yes gene_type:complete
MDGFLMTNKIYKIISASEWNAAEAAGVFKGVAIDLTDGYIHFSTASQAAETAAKHFAGQTDLLLITINPDALTQELAWEPSRGGALFPHLYGDLNMEAVAEKAALPLNADGVHVFPSSFQKALADTRKETGK